MSESFGPWLKKLRENLAIAREGARVEKQQEVFGRFLQIDPGEIAAMDQDIGLQKLLGELKEMTAGAREERLQELPEDEKNYLRYQLLPKRKKE